MMITDKQISASSEYAHYHAAIYGRVNSRNCWVAKNKNRNQWLQIDLVGHNYIVTWVATQGRHSVCRCRQWVKSFFLQYKGRDDETFQDYKAQGETTRKVRLFKQMKKIITHHVNYWRYTKTIISQSNDFAISETKIPS